ncbi:MAG: sulfatase [Myxococcota bacterium]|nr:sulfatase [Myxococcota bacterium]
MTRNNETIAAPRHCILILGTLCLISCGNGGQGTVARPSLHQGSPIPPQKTTQKETAIKKTAPQAFNKIFDLTKNLHQGHLRSNGIVIDFGTDAQFKHTLGNWRTGWAGAFSEGDVTYAMITSRAAHIYFDAWPEEAGGGARLTFRARSASARQAKVYLNGDYAGLIDVPADDFGHAEVTMDDGLVPGQNEILIRCQGRTPNTKGDPGRIAVDYVRITSQAHPTGPAAASYNAVLYPDASGGPDGLLLSAGESIAYHLPISNGMRFRARVHAHQAGVEARLGVIGMSPSGDAQDLFDIRMKEKTRLVDIDLAAYAGQMLALNVRAEMGSVVLREAGLYEVAQPAKDRQINTVNNIALVLIDTLRADRLSSYNPNTRVRTPYLDRLSTEAVVFERALVPENWTKPSVASLLSGVYPSTHGTKDDRDKLPDSVRLIQEHLRELGFATAGFVANGYVSDRFGFERGWDTWTNYVREGKPNRAQFVVDDAIAWLNKTRPAGKPFFLYVHTIDPHVPYIPPKRYWSMYDSGPYRGPVTPTQTAKLLERVKTGKLTLSDRDKIRLEALYDGEISYHDDHLVRLHQALEAHGLLDNTLIIVTSDHGEEFFEHGRVGHGHSLYEELLHVPLMVRVPGNGTDGAARTAEEVSLVDVYGTICELLGIEVPAGLEGQSLVPLLEGGKRRTYPGAAFSEFMAGQRAARLGRYKIIYKGTRPLLYDLKEDPRESQDLSKHLPVALGGMRDIVGVHLKRFSPTSVRAGRPKRSNKVTIDPQTERQLKALGYLGGED